MEFKSFQFSLVMPILLAFMTTAQSFPTDLHQSNEMLNKEITQRTYQEDSNQFVEKLTHLQNDPFEPVNLLAPVVQPANSMRSSRAISNVAKHETVVTANPVKIYKSKIDYLNDMEGEETRPKRKSYGSFISPGPYQKPLSIAIPPLTTEPEQAARRVYHLEDGFVPIVTNHGSALEANPEPRGVILNLAPQVKTQSTTWNNNEVETEDTSDLRTRRKADHGNDFEDGTHNSEKKHTKSIRGRRTRKGRKRTNSDALKSINSSQTFKPSFHQKRKSSNKFKPLNRNPRQQKSRPTSDDLKVITSNQIVQVSQEKDRKYHFEYTGESGVSRIEDGYLKNPDSEKPIQVVKGSYSYIGPDEKVYTINYIADENGYRATGAHLPVPP